MASLVALAVFFLLALEARAWPRFIGDLDGDGRATVVDLTRLVEHLNGLTPLAPALVAFADINQDGQVNETDVAPLADAILEKTILPTLKDTDRDGLPDLIEIAVGLDPNQTDSDNNGIQDSEEDPDADSLRNLGEIAHGTDPHLADTDGDGWNDEAEVAAGSDPLLASSRPRLWYRADPVVTVMLPSGLAAQGADKLGLTMAAPPLTVSLPSAGLATGVGPGITLARPPVTVVLPSSEVEDGLGLGMTLATPLLTVSLPSPSLTDGISPGIVLAYPPATLVLPASIADGEFGWGTTLATPPLKAVLTSLAAGSNGDLNTIPGHPSVKVIIEGP